MFRGSNWNCLLLIIFLAKEVGLSFKTGSIRNCLLKPKSNSGCYHDLLMTPGACRRKRASTVVKVQQLPNIDLTDHVREIFRLKGTKYNS